MGRGLLERCSLREGSSRQEGEGYFQGGRWPFGVSSEKWVHWGKGVLRDERVFWRGSSGRSLFGDI